MLTLTHSLSVLQRKWAGLSLGQEVEGNLLSLVHLLDHYSKIPNALDICSKLISEHQLRRKERKKGVRKETERLCVCACVRVCLILKTPSSSREGVFKIR